MRNHIKVVIIIFIVFIFPITVFSIEGEVFRGEDEIAQDSELKPRSNDEERVIIGDSSLKKENGSKKAVTDIDDKDINTLIDQFTNMLSRGIRDELKNMLYRKLEEIRMRLIQKKKYLYIANSVDREIDFELKRLFKDLKADLTSEMRKEVRVKIVSLLQNYINKYSLKPHEQPKKEVDKKVNIKKRKLRLKRSIKKRLYIKNIKVGNDIAKGQKVGKKNKLAIVITTVSNFRFTNGKLYIYAKNIKTNKKYLIYSLNPFQIGKRWAQDQLTWTGNYYKNNKTVKLANGLYKIYCLITYKKKKVGRFWGRNSKRYYIRVK